MIKDNLIELYIDWCLGRDDEISQSDVIGACTELGFEYSEIEQEALKRI